MIVVSGALVLVALIFLIIGLLQEGLQMIWLSIGTSVVAGVFLLLGALQRRGTPATTGADTADTGTEALERVTAVSLRPRDTEPADAGDTTAAAGSEGDVYVVPGRPRYHVENCRFLAGRPDVETVPVEQARDDGYTSCGVCKPDAALAAAPAADGGGDTAREEALADDSAETATVTLAEETTPEPEEAAAAPAKRAPAKRTRTAAASAGTAATTAAAKPAKKAAAAKSTAASQVVVIPDRGKYHVETCRFVRDVPGTVNLTKVAAKRQGYVPCGVCKPS